jgi:formylglycine-generating enzyme required for sulfatase activity
VLVQTCQQISLRGYPYRADDGRENLDAAEDVLRVLRGGSFLDHPTGVRCAYRDRDDPRYVYDLAGFRLVVVVRP